MENIQRPAGPVTITLISLIAMLCAPASAWAQVAEPRPGVGVDARGGAVVDPTKNVEDLVKAEKLRNDDLRIAQEKLFEAKLDAAARYNDLLSKHNQELREAAVQRLDAENKIRDAAAERLLIAEAKRIDAIRAVDVNAVAVANQRTSEQATALQTQTTASAEVLRNQVARSAEDLRALVQTTATTQLANQQQQFNAVISQIQAVSARVTTLEQSGAEGKGRQAPPDPVIATLLAEVRALRDAKSTTTGVDTGRSDVVGWIVGGLALLFMFVGAIIAVINTNRKPASSH